MLIPNQSYEHGAGDKRIFKQATQASQKTLAKVKVSETWWFLFCGGGFCFVIQLNV